MDRRRGQDRPAAAEGRDGEQGDAPDGGSGDDTDSGYARPSRSARKRAAEALQKLGERLTELREPELAALDLPEELLAAVRDARRLGHTPAQARARQYIGRLMRQIDTAAIERALAERAGNWRPRAKLPR